MMLTKQKLNLSLLFLSMLLTSPTVRAEPPTIGALAELTGNFARMGEDCQRGYQVAIDQSRSKARVVFGDNQNDPKVALSEFRRMVEAEKISMLVTTRSSIGLALNPLSARLKFPLIGIVGHPRFITENSYAVRIFSSARTEAEVLVGAMMSRGESSLAIISVEDEYLLGFTSEVTKLYPQDQIAMSEIVAPTENNFAALLTRIKNLNPSAVLINVAPTQIPQLVKKLVELQISARLYSNFLVGSPDIVKTLGNSGDEIMFAELDYRKPRFLKTLKESTGYEQSSPLGYACYVALSYAFVAQSKSSTERIPVADLLNAITKIETLDGPILFDGREVKLPVLLLTIRGGEVVSP